MCLFLLLPLLLGFSVPVIAHNEFNGGDAMHRALEAQQRILRGTKTTVRTLPFHTKEQLIIEEKINARKKQLRKKQLIIEEKINARKKQITGR